MIWWVLAGVALVWLFNRAMRPLCNQCGSPRHLPFWGERLYCYDCGNVFDELDLGVLPPYEGAWWRRD